MFIFSSVEYSISLTFSFKISNFDEIGIWRDGKLGETGSGDQSADYEKSERNINYLDLIVGLLKFSCRS